MTPTQEHPAPERAPIAVALDTPELSQATQWAKVLEPHVSVLKVGLELYLGVGSQGVREIALAAPTCDIFLDLKLHDIPNTVRAAARSVADLAPKFLTVHALGGAGMIAAAVDAVPQVHIAAVTVLTSMTEVDLKTVGLQGPPDDAVRRLGELAVGAGARALVCSPHEVRLVRDAVGPAVTLITPGVRPATASADDQARVSTPEQALADGADLLVIGRPITSAADPTAAAQQIGDALIAR